MYFKLDENKNVIKSSLEEWCDFIEGRLPTNYKHVADEKVNDKRISTIFIGLCYDFNNSGIPMVFETMVFDHGQGIYQTRCATWQEAEEGHQKAIEWVKNGCIEEEEESNVT